MSQYTTQLRYLVEQYAGLDESAPYTDVDTLVTLAAPRIFEKFPIYDEEHRLELEKKILRHYYMEEIGAETPGLWKLFLNNRMHEIMPYYNEMYKTAAIDYDILTDFDYTESGSDSGEKSGTVQTVGSSSGSNEITASNTGKNTIRRSDTPQGGLKGIESNTYLSSAEIGDTTGSTHSSGSSSASSTTNTGTGEESSGRYEKRAKGKKGGLTYTAMIQEYRKAVINIDLEIINKLSDLFMLVY